MASESRNLAANPKQSEGNERKVVVPAREGRAVLVHAGELIRVRDLEGNQCVDFWAFSANDVSEYLSAGHTRVHIDRLFPRVGEQFVTNRRRPILLFERDESPGFHDMLCAACDSTRYTALGVKGWHGSCQENLQIAMREVGFDEIEVPQSVNIFMHMSVHEDGSLKWEPIKSKAGDFVDFRAEMDCYAVVSACPQDVTSLNGGKPTPASLEILA